MRSLKESVVLSLLLVCHFGAVASKADQPPPARKTRNVILVTLDGMRWQEVFRGAEKSLINKPDGNVEDIPALKKKFWRETPEDRREALMPFLWKTLARQGQIFGNADQDSPAKVTNGKNFSYPGYNELFTGWPDPRVDSNDKIPNPNVTVFEWLNKRPGFEGKVLSVGAWDVYPFILNLKRSGIASNAGWEPIQGKSLTDRELLLNEVMARSVQQWPGCRDDVFTFQVGRELLKRDKPRVLYIGLGDTDEYAHEGKYDRYLEAAHQIDANLKTLWDDLQAIPQYRDATTLIISTDHGRGDPPRGWQSHGQRVKGSESIWIAVLGPDTPPLGERKHTPLVTQAQVAATLAAAVGEDFNAAEPRAAKPIAEAIPPATTKPATTKPATPAPTTTTAIEQPLERIAFGSCATQARPQPIWDAVAATKPELLLLMGDNIYADTTDMAVMRRKYAQFAAMPGFQKLRATVPILATWDDHDLGKNDAGADYPKKEESQKEFLDFFGDSPNSPRRKRQGVYDAKVFGPEGKRVQVIMLDTRYFRSSPLLRKDKHRPDEGPYIPNPDPSTTMLGEDQWTWFKDQLKVPAQLRLIVSSIQVVAQDHGWEKWMNLPLERERLFRTLKESQVDGVLFLSGDRHLAELSMMDAGLGYPLYDITASGFNQAFRAWRPYEPNQHRVATMNWGDNFGTIQIDWNRPDPLLRLQIRDVQGEVVIQQKVWLSTLKRKPKAS